MAALIDQTGYRNRMDSVGAQEIAYAIFVNTKGDDVVRVPLAPSARNHAQAAADAQRQGAIAHPSLGITGFRVEWF